MVRKIIKIDRDMCNGCGLCVTACHEGAIGMVDGKAVLLRDDYCDGLGDCLPVCPTGAITFEEREAAAYNEAEVKKNSKAEPLPCGCPSTHAKRFERGAEQVQAVSAQSNLNQWPVQIKLVPTGAPYFENAKLLVAADCAAYACGSFHADYMRDRITIIGCPKLDDVDYSQKLAAIIKNNNIKSVTVVRMEVPCCGGIEHAVKAAISESGKLIPWHVVTLATDGRVVSD